MTPLRHTLARALALSLLLAGSALAADAPRAFGVYNYSLLRDPDGKAVPIVDTHDVLDFAVSPDRRMLAFIRGARETAPMQSDETATVWVIGADGKGERKLLGPRKSDKMETILHGFNSLVFSNDGKTLYVMSNAWVTSDAVHAVDIATGAERFVVDANSIGVLRNGPYAGDLVVERHKYRGGGRGGSYEGWDIVTPQGKTVMVIPTKDEDPRPFLERKGWRYE